MSDLGIRPARIPISQRVRFDVFKRDRFTCQYCGRRAPDVILECDHVRPVSDGGDNDPANLLTACEDCNRGKGAVPLAVLSDPPASYHGRCYHSLSEATWAAFFDLIGWRSEYRPQPLGSWAPNFKLHGTGWNDAVAEVRPLGDCTQAIADRIARNATLAGYHERGGLLLLLSNQPNWMAGKGFQGVQIGYFAEFPFLEPPAAWTAAYIGWSLSPDRPEVVAEVSARDDITAAHGSLGAIRAHYSEHTTALWKRAKSAVSPSGPEAAP